MGKEGKKNRWVRSLDEAGLLDEVENAWNLPDEAAQGCVIRVEGTRKERDDEKTVKTSYSVPTSHSEDDTVKNPASSRIAAEEDDTVETHSDPLQEPDQSGSVPFGVPVSTKAPPPPSEQSAAELTPAEQSWFTDDDDEAVTAHERRSTGKQTMSLRSAAPKRVRGSRTSAEPRSSGERASPSDPAIIDDPPAESRTTSDVALDMLEDHLGVEERIAQMQEFCDMGNYSGALDVAEHVLQTEPDNPQARRVRDNAKDTLLHMYEAKIGSFERAPVLAIDAHEVMWRKLDPATGFVLSRVDGIVTYEDIIDICGLERFETCRILNQLLQEGIIK